MIVTRRRILALATAAALLGTGLFGAGPVAAAEEVRLRLAWWGNPDRDKRTHAAIEAYEKANPNVRIDGQALGWGDYWTKLATQVVGGNPPDIIQMDYRYLYEYARRGVIRPLDGLIELPDFSEPVIAAGTVDGKLQAVSLGASGWALYYNADLLQELGVPAPQSGWSWADYEATARRVAELGGGRIAGAADMGGEEAVLEILAPAARQVALRQRGQARLHGGRCRGMVRLLGRAACRGRGAAAGRDDGGAQRQPDQ